MTYFEDLRIEARTELGEHTFTREEIVSFAVEWDPQRFHLDDAAAAKTHFGRLAASGWQTAAICVRLQVLAQERADALARARGETVPPKGPSPGLRDMKWHRPVFVDDTITYKAEIIGLKAVPTMPGWGLREQRSSGVNQHGALVYSVVGSKLVARRPPAKPSPG